MHCSYVYIYVCMTTCNKSRNTCMWVCVVFVLNCWFVYILSSNSQKCKSIWCKCLHMYMVDDCVRIFVRCHSHVIHTYVCSNILNSQIHKFFFLFSINICFSYSFDFRVSYNNTSNYSHVTHIAICTNEGFLVNKHTQIFCFVSFRFVLSFFSVLTWFQCAQYVFVFLLLRVNNKYSIA